MKKSYYGFGLVAASLLLASQVDASSITVDEQHKTVVVEPEVLKVQVQRGEAGPLKVVNDPEGYVEITHVISDNPEVVKVDSQNYWRPGVSGQTHLNVIYRMSSAFYQKYNGYKIELRQVQPVSARTYRYLYSQENVKKQLVNFVDDRTTPRYVYVGDKGQVKNNYIPAFGYGVVLATSDSGVINVQNYSKWEAVKPGKVQIKVYDQFYWTNNIATSADQTRVEFLKVEADKANIGVRDSNSSPVFELEEYADYKGVLRGNRSDKEWQTYQELLNGNWNVTVIEKQSMFRLYNPNSGEHFYTQSLEEAKKLWEIGWEDENIAWVSADKNDKPVYRLYNPNAGDHHYTLDVKEKDSLIKKGWDYEGISWYSAGETPLYRLYNPNAKEAGAHHFTKDIKERDSLVKVGWQAEGIAWYGK